jgi:hypothetical protein
MYTKTTAQMMTTQKTAVFTFELMKSPSVGKNLCQPGSEQPAPNPPSY